MNYDQYFYDLLYVKIFNIFHVELLFIRSKKIFHGNYQLNFLSLITESSGI